jgi:two-component system, NarL family, sensor kinase
MQQTTASLILLILTIIFLITMVGFVINLLFFVQKKEKGFTSDLMAVKANYDKETYKAQMETQEQTTQNIAREIHDDVGQILSLVRLGLGTLDFEHIEECRATVVQVNDLLVRAMDSLRNMARTLSSDAIKKNGLRNSIYAQTEILQKTGKYQIEYLIRGDVIQLDENREIILFRIFQEAVNNILKHASATAINILLEYDKSSLRLEIADNGRGFNLNGHHSDAHNMNGIYNMQYRAKLIESEFSVESTHEKGTKINVTTPY